MNILIADDDRIAQHLLRGALKILGHEVLLAESGTDAWNELQSETDYPLLIMEVMMPGMSGLEICRRLRAESKSKPVYIILLTGNASRESRLSGLSAGANDYITKPFDPAELRARVRMAGEFVTIQRQCLDRAERFERALENIKRLEGILPICAQCKSIRNEDNSWQKVEEYLMDHTDAICSHGICPDCLEFILGETVGHNNASLPRIHADASDNSFQ